MAIERKSVHLESALTPHELLHQLAEAQDLIAKQAAHIAELQARIAELEQKPDEAQRRGKHQATPFSKGAPNAAPKTPGRKLGHPTAHRPKPARITCTLEAPLPAHCPTYGGTFIEETVHAQYQVMLPANALEQRENKTNDG